MSDFTIRPGTATLVINEGGYAGVEVRVRLDIPIGEFHAHRAQLQARLKDEGNPLTEEDGMRTFLEQRVIEWNFKDEAGNPVPLTMEGATAAGVPSDLLYTLLQAFWLAVGEYVKPAVPLERPSKNGATSAVDGTLTAAR